MLFGTVACEREAMFEPFIPSYCIKAQITKLYTIHNHCLKKSPARLIRLKIKEYTFTSKIYHFLHRSAIYTPFL